jgi:hypothetical protein
MVVELTGGLLICCYTFLQCISLYTTLDSILLFTGRDVFLFTKLTEFAEFAELAELAELTGPTGQVLLDMDSARPLHSPSGIDMLAAVYYQMIMAVSSIEGSVCLGLNWMC